MTLTGHGRSSGTRRTRAFQAVVWLALAFLRSTAAGADDGKPWRDPADRLFSIEAWQTDRGLPQSSVNAIIQCREGYLWLATYRGVARFDGVRFVVFDSANTTMRDSRVTALFEDSRGVIWIGHESGELTRLAKGVFTPVELGGKWPGGAIQCIGENRAGSIWLISGDGHGLRLEDGLFLERFPGIGTEPGGWPEMVADGGGGLVVTRNGAVGAIADRQWSMIGFDAPAAYYSRVCPSRKGGLWVAGAGVVRRWDEKRWVEQVGHMPSELSYISSMRETRMGRVLVGTITHGLMVYEPGGAWFPLSTANGLPHNWVRCLLEDREGNIWIGTRTGLCVLRPRKVLVHKPPDNWRDAPPLSIAPGADGSVWVGSEGAGLYRFYGEQWEHFGQEDGLNNQYVWSVIEDSSGTLWAGTWSGGLFRRRGGAFSIPAELADLKAPITALLEHPPGTLWIGTSKGLGRLKAGRLERLDGMGGAAAGDVRALAAGRDDELWVGTLGSGLGRYSGSGFKTYTSGDGLAGNFFLSILHDSEGTLWIGTLEKGLCRWKGGRFSTVGARAGLPGKDIGHIEEDDRGMLWFNSSHGIFAASKAELNRAAEDPAHGRVNPVVYGAPEGLTSLAGSAGFTPSGFRDGQGRIWLPNSGGVAVVDPTQLKINELPPLVSVEEVTIGGEAAPRGPDGKVHAAAGSRQIDIAFTALSFSAPDRVRFKWRLQGVQDEWTEPDAHRMATYSYLPPGTYNFQVTACNNDGLWNDQSASLGLVVEPFFWQTLWFRLAVASTGLVLFGGSIILLQRSRHRRRLGRARREGELERERARIAQDIHDDLGASLTRIGMLSQTAMDTLQDPQSTGRYLAQIYTAAREMTRGMDEIVWAVNPRHDTLESLFNYLTRFAHEFLTPAKIRCRLNVPNEFQERPVRSDIRHNLFLAFKETLNNAVLHSGADEVQVSITLQGETVTVAVKDNGQGRRGEPKRTLSPEAQARIATGHGLNNIKVRLESIGGSARISTEPGKGMEVILIAPLNRTEASR